MAAPAKRKRRLWDAYALPDFRPEGTVRGIFGDPKARIIRLTRRSKNAVRCVRPPTQRLVRSHGTSGARSFLRRHANISRIRRATRILQALRQSETRAARIFGRQHAFYQAVRLLCRPALPPGDDQGCG